MKNDEIMFDFFVKNARAMIVDEYVERIEKVVEKCRTQGKYHCWYIIINTKRNTDPYYYCIIINRVPFMQFYMCIIYHQFIIL